jgi:serine/threonine-protein kinase
VASAAGYLGGSWAEDGSIVFAQEGGIFSVPGTGGTPSLLLAVDRERGELGLNPVMLPGGRNVMFTLMAAADPQQATTRSIVVQSLGSEDRRVVIQNGADARYLETGHLVYADGSTLLVVPFDVDSLSVTGTPIPGATQVANQPVNRIADFAVSRSGSLVYRTGAWRIRTLAWVDREGRQEAVGAPARAYDYARLSPDGTKIAVSLRDEGEDIFVFDIASKAFTRITFDPGTDYLPVWTDDARRVVFASIAQSGSRIIARKAVDGTGAIERLFDAGADVANPVALLPSGTELVFRQITPEGRNNLWLLPLDGSGVANPLLATEHDEFNGEVSPDGRWLAYQSEESGSFEIYLRPFPDVDGGKWQVSNGGGIQPLWSPDGTELFYLASGRLMGLSIGGGAAPAIGAPRVILPELTYTPYERSGRTYDISPDGRRFLILHTPTTVSDDPFDGLNRFEVVLNWSEELAPQ